ncbi:MAG: hypothetical protein KKG47_09770 [Proteobacteria bacterium]|nr:hypothetical protein [Pseudomonadota bacterium]MBU1736561.1 hypothetical protein [Pseudomonadota bacterium]
MNENDQQAKAITRTKERFGFRSTGRIDQEEKPVSRYTLFVLGATAIFAGFWAITCFIAALSSNGPLDLFKKLTSALLGR